MTKYDADFNYPQVPGLLLSRTRDRLLTIS